MQTFLGDGNEHVGAQGPGDANQMLGEVGVDLPRARCIGVGQRVARNRRAPKARVVEPPGLWTQIDLDVAQRLSASQLRKGHGQELVQAAEILDFVLAPVSSDAAAKCAQWQKRHELVKHELALMHVGPLRASAKGHKSASRRSNRDQTEMQNSASRSSTYDALMSKRWDTTDAWLIMKKIAAFTTGINVPSARFRIRQLIEELKSYDLMVNELPACPSSYAPSGHFNRVTWFSSLLRSRLADLRAARGADLYIFQKELISTLPTFEFLFRDKSIFDVDDAIWLKKGGVSAKFIAKNVKSVVVANKFLYEYFSQYNLNVYVIPTAVDTKKFLPFNSIKDNRKFVIGWSGTSGGFGYFDKRIQKQISTFLKNHSDTVFRVTSNSRPNFEYIDSARIEYIPWSSSNEAEIISGFDVGLMPLDDSMWARGKSSYKMLLYMSCNVPVLVSPVGMNADLLNYPEPPGLSAGEDNSAWLDSLEILYKDEDLRQRMGNSGRRIAIENYDIYVVALQWKDIILKNVNVN